MPDNQETNKNPYRDNPLWNMGLAAIKELETDHGIMASGKDEIYGCVFGRDSLITALKLLKAHKHTQDPYFLSVVKKILVNLASLQGRDINIESGEEPGKILHEFRPTNHEHLTARAVNPWFVYADGTMRNYDSVDSTPLFLMAAYRYYQASRDRDLIDQLMPNIYGAIDWIVLYGDTNHDGLMDYNLNTERTHGGPVTQSWMDSEGSVFHEDGSEVSYPVAPIEVQAYTYVALRYWAEFFRRDYEERSRLLDHKADHLKERFNEAYVFRDKGLVRLACGVDGKGKQLASSRSSIGHCLWASRRDASGQWDSIIDAAHINDLVRQLFSPDLFEPVAGIRTLSSDSCRYSPNSYHNGSIWPHDNALIAEGLELFGYEELARALRKAMSAAVSHFGSPIELFVFTDGNYYSYHTEEGHTACIKQAWCAAALVSDSV